MLDRGQHLDWFDAREIQFYAVLMGLAAWMTVVHVNTRNDTYVRPVIFRDRNFALGCVMSAGVGVLPFATIPLTSVLLQHNLGMSAMQTGMLGLPRSFGTLVCMILVSRLIGRVDSRLILLAGFILNGFGLYLMAGISPEVDTHYLVVAGLYQGFGSGLVFPTLSTVVFATLAGPLRTEGAAMFALMRNMGTSLGVSLLQTETVRSTAVAQSRLTEFARADNPLIQSWRPDLDFGSVMQMAGLHREIFNQANMTAYVGSFWLTFVLALAMLPVVALMAPSRKPRQPSL